MSITATTKPPVADGTTAASWLTSRAAQPTMAGEESRTTTAATAPAAPGGGSGGTNAPTPSVVDPINSTRPTQAGGNEIPGGHTVGTGRTPIGTLSPNRTSELTMGEIDPRTQTVAGQLQGLLSSGNPLVQQARTNTRQYANQRGLLNSAMAASAGEQAAFNAMMPVAQQDAQTYNSQSAMNQATANQDYFQGAAESFNREMTQVSQNFQQEMTQLNFSQDMQKSLLGAMNTMLNTNNSLLASMAASPDVTPDEYAAVRESFINSLTTFTNIWAVSAGSSDTFDFSGI